MLILDTEYSNVDSRVQVLSVFEETSPCGPEFPHMVDLLQCLPYGRTPWPQTCTRGDPHQIFPMQCHQFCKPLHVELMHSCQTSGRKFERGDCSRSRGT